MALAVKLSLADRTSLRKAHRTNAAIFMDQRLFLRRVYRVVFFPHGWTPFFPWMFYELSFSALMSLFSRGALRVTVIFFIVQHLFSVTSVSSCVFFPRAWKAVFPTAYISSLFFSLLDQRPFFSREHIESSSFFCEIRIFYYPVL